MWYEDCSGSGGSLDVHRELLAQHCTNSTSNGNCVSGGADVLLLVLLHPNGSVCLKYSKHEVLGYLGACLPIGSVSTFLTPVHMQDNFSRTGHKFFAWGQ